MLVLLFVAAVHGEGGWHAETDCGDLGTQLQTARDRNCTGEWAGCQGDKEQQINGLQHAWDTSCASATPSPSPEIAPQFDNMDGCVGLTDGLEPFNTLIFGDFVGTADTGGRLFVGGTAELSDYSISDDLPSAEGTRDDLVVGKIVKFKGGRIHGNVVYGEGEDVAKDVLKGWWGETKLVKNASRFDFSAARAYYDNLSLRLSQTPPTGNTVATGSKLLSYRGDARTEIFQTNCSDISKSFSMDIPGLSGDASVIYNIAGKDCVFNIQQKMELHKNVLYNFFEAETIEISSTAMQGSVLAPHALIKGSGGYINGQTIAAGWLASSHQKWEPSEICLPCADCDDDDDDNDDDSTTLTKKGSKKNSKKSSKKSSKKNSKKSANAAKHVNLTNTTPSKHHKAKVHVDANILTANKKSKKTKVHIKNKHKGKIKI